MNEKHKTDTKNEAKSLKATTLLSQSYKKSDTYMGSNREKSNIAIATLENYKFV